MLNNQQTCRNCSKKENLARKRSLTCNMGGYLIQNPWWLSQPARSDGFFGPWGSYPRREIVSTMTWITLVKCKRNKSGLNSMDVQGGPPVRSLLYVCFYNSPLAMVYWYSVYGCSSMSSCWFPKAVESRILAGACFLANTCLASFSDTMELWKIRLISLRNCGWSTSAQLFQMSFGGVTGAGTGTFSMELGSESLLPSFVLQPFWKPICWWSFAISFQNCCPFGSQLLVILCNLLSKLVVPVSLPASGATWN